MAKIHACGDPAIGVLVVKMYGILMVMITIEVLVKIVTDKVLLSIVACHHLQRHQI